MAVCFGVTRLKLSLIPFSGSDSEIIGAMLVGWDEIVGIEMSPEYVAIAEKRLVFWSEQMEKCDGDVDAILKSSVKQKSTPIPEKESLTSSTVSVESGISKSSDKQKELF